MSRTLKLLVVAGARPNFMKIAPLLKAFAAHNERSGESGIRLEWKLVHTGQHYHAKMSDVFFTELGIPAPDINLGIGSGSHAAQTAAIMTAFEPVVLSAFAQKLEDGGQKTEDGGQKTEDGGQAPAAQKMEDGSEKIEDGRQKTEDGGQAPAAQKREEGRWKMGESSDLRSAISDLPTPSSDLPAAQKMEDGSEKIEDGRQKIEDGRQAPSAQKMEDGRWKMGESSDLRSAISDLPTPSSDPPAAQKMEDGSEKIEANSDLRSRISELPSSNSDLPSSNSHSPFPDWVIVVGDVNSTMACTLVAAKLGVRVAHVEAGLRSFDRTMPEEINRIVTDALADLLLTPSEDAGENLRREGVPDAKIRFVGNIMIDSLVSHLENANNGEILKRLGLPDKGFIYVTLHRPANVDEKESLSRIVSELKRIATSYPVVFPIHPRTSARLREFGLSLEEEEGVQLLDPIGYHDSVALTRHARCVLTDSGGLQEESTYFRTPCLTLRPNTERPVTITHGSNRLTRPETLQADFAASLQGEDRGHQAPALWDGHTAERIVQELIKVP